jgi:hypothetical protein
VVLRVVIVLLGVVIVLLGVVFSRTFVYLSHFQFAWYGGSCLVSKVCWYRVLNDRISVRCSHCGDYLVKEMVVSRKFFFQPQKEAPPNIESKAWF